MNAQEMADLAMSAVLVATKKLPKEVGTELCKSSGPLPHFLGMYCSCFLSFL